MGLITSKVRLYVEYAIIAVLLATIGLAVTLKMQTIRLEGSVSNLTTGLDNANNEIAVVRSVNDAQEEVISTLGAQRQKDSNAVAKLLDTYQTLRETDQRIRSKLDTLEKTDVQAKAYFDSDLPESVACVYDDSCPATSAGQTSSSEAESPSGPIASMLLAPEEKAVKPKGRNSDLPRLEGVGANVRGGNAKPN